jgi:hypothetical protein
MARERKEKRVCCVEGCNSTNRTVKWEDGNIYCGKHYTEIKRYGNISLTKRIKIKEIKICEVIGCDNIVHAKGFCDKHYKEFNKHGKILTEKEKEKEVKVCCVEGCGRTDSKGATIDGNRYCGKHYSQMKTHGKISKRTIHDSNEIVECNDYAEIMLYKNNEVISKTLIALEDIDRIKRNKWTLLGNGYVYSKKLNQYLHRYIMNASPEEKVDHIDGNPLNNKRDNLRICTQQNNIHNSALAKNNTSGCTGVYKYKDRWLVKIMVNYKTIRLGCYDNFDDAVKVRKEAEEKYFGEFAPKNRIKYIGSDFNDTING